MRTEEVVVVGGGVAGFSAALAARERGASVTLIDEGPEVGGYMRWVLSVQPDLPTGLAGKRGVELARAGWDLLYDADVNVQLRSTAWGFSEENVLGVVNPESSYQLTAERVILATGSTDRVIPFSGWEMAGVMTARAALIAINVHRVLPGRRVALVGDGPEVDEVRTSLELAGADVAVHCADPALARAVGDGRLQWLEVVGDRVDIDAVVMVCGVQPDPYLALQALAETGYSEHAGYHVPVRRRNLETSLSGVYLIGDAAGACSTAEAMAEGTVAGEAATNGAGLEDALEKLDGLRSKERRADLEKMQLGAGVS